MIIQLDSTFVRKYTIRESYFSSLLLLSPDKTLGFVKLNNTVNSNSYGVNRGIIINNIKYLSTLVAVHWWQYTGASTLVPVHWCQYTGGSTQVPVQWWQYTGGSTLVPLHCVNTMDSVGQVTL